MRERLSPGTSLPLAVRQDYTKADIRDLAQTVIIPPAILSAVVGIPGRAFDPEKKGVRFALRGQFSTFSTDDNRNHESPVFSVKVRAEIAGGIHFGCQAAGRGCRPAPGTGEKATRASFGVELAGANNDLAAT